MTRSALPVIGSRRTNGGIDHRDLCQPGRGPRTGQLPSRSPRCPKRPMNTAFSGDRFAKDSRSGSWSRRGPKKWPKRIPDGLLLARTPTATPSVRNGMAKAVPSPKALRPTTTPVVSSWQSVRPRPAVAGFPRAACEVVANGSQIGRGSPDAAGLTRSPGQLKSSR
jgi:hypothetical protein